MNKPPVPPPPPSPFLVTTDRDGETVLGLMVPFPPHTPADADAVTFMVHTLDHARRPAGYDAPNLTEAAKLLMLHGVKDHAIFAHTGTREADWRCQWSPTARSWGQWRIG